jgi:hypothetical protein
MASIVYTDNMEQHEEFESVLSEIKFLDEFKMTTPLVKAVLSNIDIIIKSEREERKALVALVAHLKAKIKGSLHS